MQETSEQIRDVDQVASGPEDEAGDHPDTTAGDRRPAEDESTGRQSPRESRESPGEGRAGADRQAETTADRPAETTAKRLAEPAERAETDVLMLRAVDDVGGLWLDPETGDWVVEPTDDQRRATRLSAPSVQRLIDRGDLAERTAEDRTSTRLTEAGRDRLRAGTEAEERYLLWSQASEMVDAVEREFGSASPGARLSVELELLWDDGTGHRVAVTAPAGGVDDWGEKILAELEETMQELDKERYPLALTWETDVDEGPGA